MRGHRAARQQGKLGAWRHIASFQSAATLYDTGFMHFWRAASEKHGGDLVYFQGIRRRRLLARLP